MTKTIRTLFSRLRPRDPVIRMTREQVEARADAIARNWVHVESRHEAFRKLDRGELAGTMADPELRALRDMLSA
jgi:hypothetical protein